VERRRRGVNASVLQGRGNRRKAGERPGRRTSVPFVSRTSEPALPAMMAVGVADGVAEDDALVAVDPATWDVDSPPVCWGAEALDEPELLLDWVMPTGIATARMTTRARAPPMKKRRFLRSALWFRVAPGAEPETAIFSRSESLRRGWREGSQPSSGEMRRNGERGC
jgi:hypothetical protein